MSIWAVNGNETPLTVSIVWPAVVRLRPVIVPETLITDTPADVSVNVP
jgi:hypothetical protein